MSRASLRNATFTKDIRLGSGAMSDVWKCKCEEDGRFYAVKIIPLDQQRSLDSIACEVRAMTQCRFSNNCVHYYTSQFHQGNELWLVMELLGGGSIRDFTRRKPLDEPTVRFFVRGMLEGLRHLHEMGFIHRDIKADNVLLSCDAEVKLADFGLVADYPEPMSSKGYATKVGSPYWMSPEIISSTKYGPATDIWSIGITCIELATGIPPRAKIHPMRVMAVISDEDPPTLPKNDKLSKPFYDFVNLCLQKDPAKRPSAKDLLRHKFLKKPTLLSRRKSSNFPGSLKRFVRARSTSRLEWLKKEEHADSQIPKWDDDLKLERSCFIECPPWTFSSGDSPENSQASRKANDDKRIRNDAELDGCL